MSIQYSYAEMEFAVLLAGISAYCHAKKATVFCRMSVTVESFSYATVTQFVVTSYSVLS